MSAQPNQPNQKDEHLPQAESVDVANDQLQETPEMLASEHELSDGFAKVQEELKEMQDRYVRVLAEFDNFKKRAERERQYALKFGSENLLRDLLPVLDHLEQAVAAVETAGNKDAAVANSALTVGVKMVLKQFQDALNRHGIENFSALGKPFDPNLHEAIGQLDSDAAEGTVLEEFQRGYLLNGRVVRPARVIVAKTKATPTPSE